MRNYIYTGNAMNGRHSTLKHYKYISRKRVGDKWVYEYPDEDKASARRAQADKVARLQANKAARIQANKAAIANKAKANATKDNSLPDDSYVSAKRKVKENAGYTKSLDRASARRAQADKAANIQANKAARIQANKDAIANRAKANATKKEVQIDPQRREWIHTYTKGDGITRGLTDRVKNTNRLFSRTTSKVVDRNNKFEYTVRTREIGQLERAVNKGKKWLKKFFGG